MENFYMYQRKFWHFNSTSSKRPLHAKPQRVKWNKQEIADHN